MTDNETKTRTVYLICHKGSEIGKDTYVRSTSQTLDRRLSAHKSNASRPGNEENKFYKRMREVGLRNWVIRPLESMICSSDDIRRSECTWCQILRSDLNSNLPIRPSEKKSGPTVQTVYMIHNKNLGVGRDTYLGSTSQTLSKRLSAHRSVASRPGSEANKFYKRMREVGFENWEIVPLLTLECTRDEICAFECEWADLLEVDLNSVSPMTTPEENRKKSAVRYAANREKLAAYYAANRETILEKKKAYRAANHETILEKKKAYRAANREILREKAGERRARVQEQKSAFGSNKSLKKHDILKHQFTFLNSLD